MSGEAFIPRLEPADRSAGPDAHEINLTASAWWSSSQTFSGWQRRQHLPQLLLRKRRGTRAEPVQRTQGVYTARDIETAEKERRRHVGAAIMRLMAWATLRSNWRTNEIGLWRGGRIHYPSRCQMADGAGFAVVIDSKKRVRCWEMDDRVEDAIAAGLCIRIVEKDAQGRPPVFKLTALAWQLAGVALKRKMAMAAEDKAQKKAERPPKPAADVGAVVGLLSRGADFYAGDAGAKHRWPPRPKERKPPT